MTAAFPQRLICDTSTRMNLQSSSNTSAAAPDTRFTRLVSWVHQVLGRDGISVSVASADASFRRYFRVHRDADTWIVMDAAPDKEDTAPFINVSRMLVDAQVNAPRVLAENRTEGYLLLTDLGLRTYLSELERGIHVEELYGDALQTLERMQRGVSVQAHSLPVYDAALLRRELDLFPEWFLGRHLGFTPDEAQLRIVEDAFSLLIRSALEQPQVFVHRDYHSRNLMITDGSRQGVNPGVLDFQDAVYGALTYDLVSLVRDCYITWPNEQVENWVLQYRRQLSQTDVGIGRDEAQFLRWFDLMGLQRHLKVLGIFARLWHRDGKRGYLKDLPRVMDYVMLVCAKYPELAPLHAFLERVVIPAWAKLD
jgi:aminoglycoside/choline kinase family phosphotransferase